MKISTRGVLAAGRQVSGFLCLLVSVALLLFTGAFDTELIWSLLCLATFAAGLALLRLPRAMALTWFLYVTGFLLFIKLRLYADDLSPLPVQFDYVIRADSYLFGGTLPTLALQDRYYELGSPTWGIKALVVVYLTYVFVPHLLALCIAIWRPIRDLWRYVVASMICYYTAVLVSFVVPTAPPWMAGQLDYTRHAYRVVLDIFLRSTTASHTGEYPMIDGNSVAAMPSLHMAIAVVCGFGLWVLNPRAAVLGVLYAGAMGLALVTLGEHYVADILAGVVLAFVAWQLSGRPALSRIPGS